MRSIGLMILLGLLWGGQFTLMTIALGDYSYLEVSVIRSFTGALTLGLIAMIIGLKADSSRWGLYMLLALVDATIPFASTAWGLERVPSSLGSIILGSIPFLTLVFAPFVLQGFRLNRLAVASVVVGFVGLLVLFGPSLINVHLDSIWGFSAVAVGALSFALGMLLINRYCTESPIIVARNILFCGGVQLLLLSLVMGGRVPDVSVIVSSSTLSAIVLGVVATGFAYFLFMYLIQKEGATFASMSNYLVPVVGTILGVLAFGEHVDLTMLIALALVLVAIVLKRKSGV